MKKNFSSVFSSVCMALGGTIGVGNISGMAAALSVGGPGSVFWMWIAGLIAMGVGYAENVLGCKYLRPMDDSLSGKGPLALLEKGTSMRWPAYFYSFFCVLASLCTGNMSQVHEISAALQRGFSVSPLVCLIFLFILTAFILFHGRNTLSAFLARLVPFMLLLYILSSFIVLYVCRDRLFSSLHLILVCALNPSALHGAVTGFTLTSAIKTGALRSLFSNEAGMGSSVFAHELSGLESPHARGLLAVFEIFTDTFFLCSLTALVILCSGIYVPAHAKNPSGILLTIESFSVVFQSCAKPLLALSILLFSFSSILSWYYYGSHAAAYLTGRKFPFFYLPLFLVMLIPGCLLPLEKILIFSDLFNLILLIPNISMLILLFKEIFT